MNHKQKYYYQLILLYFSGKLSEKKIKELENWINASPENQALFNHLHTLWFSEHPFEKDYSYEPALQKVKQSIKASKKGTTRPMMLGRKEIVRLAAMLVLLLGSILAVGLLKAPLSQPQESMVHVQRGQQRILTLPDGSRVWLNGSSSLRYPESFQGSAVREVQLQGEAFFEMVKDAEHPFIVTGEKLQVKVLGTRFNFISDKQLGHHQVTVTEGKVEVSSRTDASQAPVIITPQERITYTPLAALVHSQTQGSFEVPWQKAGSLSFNKVPFSEVVQVLERNYDVTISYPAALRSYPVTVSLERNSIHQAMRTLRDTVSFNWLMENKNIKIRLKQ